MKRHEPKSLQQVNDDEKTNPMCDSSNITNSSATIVAKQEVDFNDMKSSNSCDFMGEQPLTPPLSDYAAAVDMQV